MMMQSRQSILVVDDMAENIDLLCEVLQDDYRVKVALNGREALEIVHSDEAPDLILMDVMMPEMDGYEACRRIKEDLRTRHIPIIFVTSMADVGDEMRGFELGAVDYITKPITPVVVLARVKTHLALHNQSLALEQKVAERTADLYATRLEIVHRLGVAAEYRDNETGQHILRMSNYCRILGLGLGLRESRADILLNAAPMHDVGKIGIPDSILSKPGKLDADEWKVMQTHPEMGAMIIGVHSYELMIVARRIALTHHEKWDGTGYPQGLSGEEIPIEGRIAAIADVFDALTSDRPYKTAWPVEDARSLIREEKGGHFDPALVDVFMEHWDEILDARERFLS